jgi:hypothetical protein
MAQGKELVIVFRCRQYWELKRVRPMQRAGLASGQGVPGAKSMSQVPL